MSTPTPRRVALGHALLWLSSRFLRRSLGPLAMLVAVVLATSAMRRDLARLERFHAPITRLTLGPAPSTLSSLASSELSALTLPRLTPSAFEGRLVPTLAYALTAFPWVERVQSLRLRYPNQIEFSLALREPKALLKHGQEDFALSGLGQLYPSCYVAKGGQALPRILGLDLNRDGQRGLDLALALLERLEQSGLMKAAQLTALDFSNLDGRRSARASEIVLINRHGLRVDWGRLESSRRLHRPFRSKAEDLKRCLGKNHELSGSQSLALRWQQPVYIAKAPPAEPQDAGRRP